MQRWKIRKVSHPFIPTVSELSRQFPDADLVLSLKPAADNEDRTDIPAYHLAEVNESFTADHMKIHTIKTRPGTLSSTGNLGYLVDEAGVKILHSGLHRSSGRASQTENYKREIDFLKSFTPIDFAVLPVGYQHLDTIDYEPYLYLIDQLAPEAIYPIGDDLKYEEHLKCLEVLRKREVPVFYPDGGIAQGQRFYYTRD